MPELNPTRVIGQTDHPPESCRGHGDDAAAFVPGVEHDDEANLSAEVAGDRPRPLGGGATAPASASILMALQRRRWDNARWRAAPSSVSVSARTDYVDE